MTTIESHSTKQEILKYLLKQGQATSQDLAGVFSITQQAVRKHLKDLEEENLVEHEVIQGGMGRPYHLYRLSSQGKELFPHGYDEFALSFLDLLTETLGEEQVEVVLRKQWERKAKKYRQKLGKGSLKTRLAKLVKLRQEEGYMAELYPEKQGRYILVEHHCVISEVAESFPSVCGNELEMFATVLPDCTVERTHWLNNGEHLCGYLIQAKTLVC